MPVLSYNQLSCEADQFHSTFCPQHSCFFIFLISVELVVGIGGAVISACVGGGSEMRAQFYRNSTDEIELAKHHSYWDKIQYEVRFIDILKFQTLVILLYLTY